MTSYTLDPSKVESTSAPTHSPIYPSATPAYSTITRVNAAADPVYPPGPPIFPQGTPGYPQGAPGYPQGTLGYPSATHQYYPYQYPPVANVQPETRKIRDWLAWSIINIFLTGLLPGVLPLIFTLICRSKKRKNDLRGARTMSTLALVFNVICTIIGIVALVAIIIYLVVSKRSSTAQYVYGY